MPKPNRSTRNVLMHVLRAVRFLSLANWLRFVWSEVRDLPGNLRFRRRHPGFAVPPAWLAYDAYASTSHGYYDRLGTAQAEYWARLIKHYGVGRRQRILDWGCGPARIVRQMPAFFPSGTEFWGTDYNPRSIRWARAHIRGIHFELNGLLPPLLFEPGHFDCIYCISVFTHLSEPTIVAWCRELFRVLRPGGILVFTTMGDNGREKYLLEQEQRQYDNEGLVIRGFIKEGRKHYLSYASPRYVRERLMKDRRILAHIVHPYPDADPFLNQYFEQDVWVVLK